MAFLRDILRAAIEARAMQRRVDAMSARYKAGIASYGKKVRTDKRKARILAELQAMSPCKYNRVVVLPEDKVSFKGYDILWGTHPVSVKPRYRYRLTKHISQYGGYVFIDYK